MGLPAALTDLRKSVSWYTDWLSLTQWPTDEDGSVLSTRPSPPVYTVVLHLSKVVSAPTWPTLATVSWDCPRASTKPATCHPPLSRPRRCASCLSLPKERERERERAKKIKPPLPLPPSKLWWCGVLCFLLASFDRTVYVGVPVCQYVGSIVRRCVRVLVVCVCVCRGGGGSILPFFQPSSQQKACQCRRGWAAVLWDSVAGAGVGRLGQLNSLDWLTGLAVVTGVVTGGTLAVVERSVYNAFHYMAGK